MTRGFRVLAAFSLMASAVFGFSQIEPPPLDVDGDGQVTPADRSHIIGQLQGANSAGSLGGIAPLDLDGDGVISSADAVAFNDRLLGEFPIPLTNGIAFVAVRDPGAPVGLLLHEPGTGDTLALYGLKNVSGDLSVTEAVVYRQADGNFVVIEPESQSSPYPGRLYTEDGWEFLFGTFADGQVDVIVTTPEGAVFEESVPFSESPVKSVNSQAANAASWASLGMCAARNVLGLLSSAGVLSSQPSGRVLSAVVCGVTVAARTLDAAAGDITVSQVQTLANPGPIGQIGWVSTILDNNGRQSFINGLFVNAATGQPVTSTTGFDRIRLEFQRTSSPGSSQGTASPDGSFNLSVPPGSYNVRVTHTGNMYLPVTIFGIDLSPSSSVSLGIIPLSRNLPGDGLVQGRVTNAQNGQAAVGVTLRFRPGINNDQGDPVAQAVSDGNGNFSITLPPGTYTMEGVLEGYSPGFRTVASSPGSTTTGQNLSLSPVLSGDEMRIILTWSQSPSDLDSHLTGPDGFGGRFHVYFSNSNAGGASLDTDVTSSFGPETITISQWNSGTYRYSVHDYSNRSSTVSEAMSNSSATVRVLLGGLGEVRRFEVRPGRVGSLWTVFEIDGNTRQITEINQFTNQSDPSSVAKSLPEKGVQALLREELFQSPLEFSTAAPSPSKAIGVPTITGTLTEAGGDFDVELITLGGGSPLAIRVFSDIDTAITGANFTLEMPLGARNVFDLARTSYTTLPGFRGFIYTQSVSITDRVRIHGTLVSSDPRALITPSGRPTQLAEITLFTRPAAGGNVELSFRIDQQESTTWTSLTGPDRTLVYPELPSLPGGSAIIEVEGRTAHADLAFLTRFGDIWTALGDGEGGFVGPFQRGFHGYRHDMNFPGSWSRTRWQFIAGDFSGNGLTDVACVTHYGDTWVADNDGSAIFVNNRWIGSGFGFNEDIGWQVFVGDFNGDGLDDLLQITEFSDVWIAYSTGDGFQPIRRAGNPGFRHLPRQGWWVGVADVTGDGRADLVQVTPFGDVWVGPAQEDGTIGATSRWNQLGYRHDRNQGWGLHLGDFNGDGIADLLQVTPFGDVWVAESDGSTFATNRRWGTPSFRDTPDRASNRWSVHVADVTGDGVDDLIQLTPFGDVWVAPSTGDSFAATYRAAVLGFDHSPRGPFQVVTGTFAFGAERTALLEIGPSEPLVPEDGMQTSVEDWFMY